jgi:hypothetical protein
MRNFILLALFGITTNAWTQVESTSQLTLSPFITASRILETSYHSTVMSHLISTMTNLNSKGVAGKEQIRDEVVGLNADMSSGLVQSIDDVRQPAVKEFMLEIISDEKQMQEINNLIKSGSRLDRLAVAISLVLIID